MPQDARREATTVWPPGYAVFTGLAYRLSGEAGLYLVTPLLSLLSLAAAGWLAYQVVRSAYCVSDTRYAPRSTLHAPRSTLHAPRSTPSIAAVVALTVFLTATSYQQVEWQLIPMADVAAQLFSVLALALALLSGRRTTDDGRRTAVVRRLSSVVFPAMSGLCLGIAFSIRYTQVLIAPALALALWLHPSQEAAGVRVRVTRIAVCAFFALLAAAPVLIYHTAAFGSPLHTGSEEWSNFSLTRLPETLGRILSELNSHREYGLLTLFIAFGVYALWRAERRVLWVLAAYVLPLFVFHVAYWPLRLRDILSLFPVFNLLAALGAVWVVERGAWSVERARFASRSTLHALRIGLLIALSFAIVLRSMDTLALPITRGFGAFGYLVREQRESFARLAELTPPDAVVGSSLNSGAVDLHAGRRRSAPRGGRRMS